MITCFKCCFSICQNNADSFSCVDGSRKHDLNSKSFREQTKANLSITDVNYCVPGISFTSHISLLHPSDPQHSKHRSLVDLPTMENGLWLGQC